MKFAVVLVALVSIAATAPQPKKVFHEHFEDFVDLIFDEAGHDIEHVMEHYLEFAEFRTTLEYMKTANFKQLVSEMEALPEFKDMLNFLENHNIDIYYFVDMLNSLIDIRSDIRARHTLSGTNFSAFVKDCISEFPKAKLAALFEEKKAEDEAFKAAVESLESEEWQNIVDALFENEVFLAEIKTLAENGIEIDVLIEDVLAVFGQN